MPSAFADTPTRRYAETALLWLWLRRAVSSAKSAVSNSESELKRGLLPDAD
jgi:hypothetical protein